MKTNNYLEVEYLRVIAVFLLVLWHCFFCPIIVWGCVSPTPNLPILHLFRGLFIPDAVMPLFTFLSGYLFYALYIDCNKYRNFTNFIKSKINRLFIPYVILSLLIIPTISKTPIESFSKMLYGEGSHLWYCTMLFWCFIIAWIILKFNNKYLSLAIASFSAVLVYRYPNFWYLPFELPLGIDNALYYYSYFALGGAIFKYKEFISKGFDNKAWIIILAYFAFYVIEKMHICFVSDASRFIRPYVYCIVLWLVIVRLISKGYLRERDSVHRFCKYSFGIYVFHHWIAWIIVWLPCASSILNEHYLIFSFLLWGIVFPLSYYLTKIASMTKIGRYLLL